MKIFSSKYPVPVVLFILSCTLLYLKPVWLDRIENSFTDINYSLRGSRDVGDNICIIYFGDDDLKAIGEWPITRDYYSYLIHILKSSGAKTIALDILFAHPDKRHPEYDKTLSDFLQSAGNVCLPMAFSRIYKSDNDIIIGENPTFPFKNIRNHVAEIGFSNFGINTFNKRIPIKVTSTDSIYYSFGYQIAKNYLDADTIAYNKGKILVNHFGDIDKLQTMSFLNLLHTFQVNPDSLDFNNKIVLFTVTASGVVVVKRTPFNETLPASLIHLTVAENLINKTYLSEPPFSGQIVGLLSILIILFIIGKSGQKQFLIFSIALAAVYLTITFIAFTLFNIILPLFLPLMFLIFCSGYLILHQQNRQKLNDANIRDLLQKQIASKENHLVTLKKQLQDESSTAEEAKKLSDERENAIMKLQKEINDLQVHSFPETKARQGQSEIIFSEKSPMHNILELISKIDTSDIPVLITGETGTGKELIARIIHKKSQRRDKPFVAVNCGALSENLLESELFGHEKGSFTGAVSSRKGRFELASGGTIFLDEITETSTSFQIRLLRVLQEGTFERLGSEKTLRTNIRVVAASNKKISEEIENNHFRSDLFYRLNAFPIHLPSLRERIDDIEVLSMHFLKKYEGQDINISSEVFRIFKSYPWHGNVRELENIIRRAILLVKSENRKLIQEKDLAQDIKDSQKSDLNVYYSLDEQILDSLRALHFSHSAISQTAKMLDNRDRGTITEYFRGMCFEYYVKTNYNKHEAAQKLAQSDNGEIIDKVELKLSKYLENLNNVFASETAFKGLPKKYHSYLKKILKHQHSDPS